MNQHILVLWMIISQISLFSPLTFSGTIRENVTFYHRIFPVFPSKLVTIEYHVTHKEHPGYPVLYFYTTENHSDLQTRCIGSRYGQLRNENLWIPLYSRSETFKKVRRARCITDKDQRVHCSGKTTIQDYIPRKFAFSIGFDCPISTVHSIYGVSFSFTLTKQSNTTNCVKRPKTGQICGNFDGYQYMSLPNLMGMDVNIILGASTSLNFLDAFILDEDSVSCYQHLFEALCSVLAPECVPFENSVLHLCKESWKDLTNGCSHSFYKIFKNKHLSQKVIDWLEIQDTDLSTFFSSYFNWNYLPSISDSIPCFYEPVSCGDPPNVTNAFVIKESNVTPSYVEYSCQDETFYMQGNESITCFYSGKWSKPPICLKKYTPVTPLIIVLPLLLCAILALFTTHIVRKHCNHQKQLALLTRRNDYDAFVSYSYEGHDPQFAENTVKNQLEEEREFKLCIHRRDFLAAWDIMWNIDNAIKNSNSAIIVMSQYYVDSLWCKEEFEQCYIEHIKDPAFKMFVIMMQPVNHLKNISIYMEKFFANKTYLAKGDENLFPKIANYLTWVKKPKVKKYETEIVDRNGNDRDAEHVELV